MRSQQMQNRRGNSKGRTQRKESLLNRKIIAPEKLKILVLAGNDLTTDHLDFLNKCVNLIKLDLSHNHIIKLPSSLNLVALQKIEVVLLHHNKLSSLEAIHPIYKCQTISYLTYHHNPLESSARHEHEIINSLPNLKLINNRIVFVEERSDFLLSDRASVLTDSETLQNWKSTQNSQAYYLKVLSMQLQYIDNLWAFNNPIIIIQRAWRHFLPPTRSVSRSSHPTRTIHSKLQRKTSRQRGTPMIQPVHSSHPLKQIFLQWKNFSDGLRSVREHMKICRSSKGRINNSYMLLPLQNYKIVLRNMRVRMPLDEYLTKIRQRIFQRKMAKKFLASINLKQTIFQEQLSFYNISGIEYNNRLFYNRSQQHILDNFLKIIAETFNKREVIHQRTKYRVAHEFNAIRLVDPESFSNKYSEGGLHSICSLLWPSMKLVVSNRKTTASQFKSGIISIPQLTYIRNRDKVLTPTQFQKSKEVYRRLEKFALNEYETSMWCFECKDEFVMRQLIRMVYYHNAKAIKFQVKEKRSEMLSLLENFEEPFIIYADKILKRTVAAVAIQKSWRRFISNKNQSESIYQKMKKQRAALHIQRFIRDHIYRHRLHFHKKLSRDLRLCSNTLIYPLSLYLELNNVDKPRPKSSLYSRLRITRNGNSIGLSQQFFKPIFQKSIRDAYFEGQRLGTENFPKQADIYHLLHYQVSIDLIVRNGTKFISFTYQNLKEASIVASVIALLTYQPWGSHYVWPLSKQSLGQWESRIQEYLQVKSIRRFVNRFRSEPEITLALAKKPIKEHGLFLWPSVTKFIPRDPTASLGTVFVQFYQKRYHNFPVKQTDTFTYTILNEQMDIETSVKQQQNQPSELEQLPRKSLQAEEGPLNIITIDKRLFSFFEKSQKTIRQSEPETITNPQMMTQASKKEKVMRFYQEQYVRKQAQKEVKEATIAGVREKARKEKVMNSTLKSLKDSERTEALRNKVQRIKEYKQRSAQKRQEEDFVQQNNFVIQQQLKMVIMRNKLKEVEGRREDYLTKKSSLERNSDSFAPSIPSRKSSRQRQRARLQEEESNTNEIAQNQVQGEEGSVVNAKRRLRKTRAHSIGAYMRDPSFVHGVFPEEYYPIESRATSFYFPPVV